MASNCVSSTTSALATCSATAPAASSAKRSLYNTPLVFSLCSPVSASTGEVFIGCFFCAQTLLQIGIELSVIHQFFVFQFLKVNGNNLFIRNTGGFHLLLILREQQRIPVTTLLTCSSFHAFNFSFCFPARLAALLSVQVPSTALSGYIEYQIPLLG